MFKNLKIPSEEFFVFNAKVALPACNLERAGALACAPLA
jgi:hypothetical protein